MQNATTWKFLILILTSTLVFATGINQAQLKTAKSQKQSNDIIFANGFEDGTPVVATYTSSSAICDFFSIIQL